MKTAVAIGVLALVVGAAAAQCPLYPPTLSHDLALIYRGETSGCTNVPPSHDISCQPGEDISFSLVAATGREIQSCDAVRWTFSDGTSASMPGAGSLKHKFVPATWSDSDRHITAAATVTNALGSASAFAETYFPLPCFTRAIQSAAASSFIGPRSGCTQFGGTCAVGEKVKFATALAEAEASGCHKWYVDWGDGTDIETATIVEPTAHIELQHYFARTGKFAVSFELIGPTPPPPTKTGLTGSPGRATVRVNVTEQGSPAPPRHRSAGH